MGIKSPWLESELNAHSIQFHAVPGHTQEASRFKRLLEELCI